MKLTKKQALDLIKVISHYQALDSRSVCAPTMHATLGSLERFVVSEEEIDDDDLDSDKVDDCCDHSRGDDEQLGPDSFVPRANLYDLKVAKAKIISSSSGDPDDEVTLEFKNTERSAAFCDLVVNGYGKHIGPITRMRRSRTRLHVEEDNSGNRTWHHFYVPKFPDDWIDVIPLNNLVKRVE